MCVQGDVTAGMAAQVNLPAACNSFYQTLSFEGASGTITYAGDIESSAVSMTMSMDLLITQACASAMAGSAVTMDATLCSSMQQSMLTNANFKSATCSLSGGNCSCVVKGDYTSAKEIGYSLSGNTITYSDGSDPAGYCVSGNTLTERDVNPDFSSLVMVATLQRSP